VDGRRILLGNYAEVRGTMTHIEQYREEIREEIAQEFGLKAAGYLPSSLLPITIAQRINAKYPGEYKKLNPKAVQIAKRYVSIFKKYL